MPGYLIKDTTTEERKKIVEKSLGNINATCDGCMAGIADMYEAYIRGEKEIRDINMEFNARYVRGDMDKEGVVRGTVLSDNIFEKGVN